jgi:molecular chaperone GrpE
LAKILLDKVEHGKLCLIMKKKLHEKEENRQMTEENTVENGENMDEKAAEGGLSGNNEQAGASGEQPGTESSAEAAADKVVDEVRAIQEKLAEMQDKYIRLSAEFDNYRKRTLREKMELSKYAEENILSKVIPFMDDFERALQHIDTVEEGDAMKNGINLIYMKFSEFLKQSGVAAIESLNADFNVDIHEAVAKVKVDEPDKKGKVVDVVLKGYYLRDKVIRFAKVVVGE